MNLISRIYYSCERKKYALMILRKYTIISYWLEGKSMLHDFLNFTVLGRLEPVDKSCGFMWYRIIVEKCMAMDMVLELITQKANIQNGNLNSQFLTEIVGITNTLQYMQTPLWISLYTERKTSTLQYVQRLHQVKHCKNAGCTQQRWTCIFEANKALSNTLDKISLLAALMLNITPCCLR